VTGHVGLRRQCLIRCPDLTEASIQDDTDRGAHRREYERQWAAKVRAAVSRYRARHPDRRKKTKVAWSAGSKDKVYADSRAQRKRYPDRTRAIDHIYKRL
jgi:hypothetical protein